VAQLYPQALGSRFVYSYDSQGNGGGILTRLHKGQTGLLQVQFQVILRPTVNWPVCLGVGPRFHDQIFYYCRKFAVTFGSKSRRTHSHILLSHLILPQPGWPGPHIYIPREQGGPVIPPGIGFHFRRLLRLAGLRWRYSNLPPH
jgi:hypothetical protein